MTKICYLCKLLKYFKTKLLLTFIRHRICKKQNNNNNNNNNKKKTILMKLEEKRSVFPKRAKLTVTTGHRGLDEKKWRLKYYL